MIGTLFKNKVPIIHIGRILDILISYHGRTGAGLRSCTRGRKTQVSSRLDFVPNTGLQRARCRPVFTTLRMQLQPVFQLFLAQYSRSWRWRRRRAPVISHTAHAPPPTVETASFSPLLIYYCFTGQNRTERLSCRTEL